MTQEAQTGEEWKLIKDFFGKIWPAVSAFAGKVIEYTRTSRGFNRVSFIESIRNMLTTGTQLTDITNAIQNCPEKVRDIAGKVNECICNCGPEGYDAACKKLDRLMQHEFNGVSIGLLMNAINALSQSLLAWHTLYTYQIKNFERKMQRVQQYMNEAIDLLAAVIDEGTHPNFQAKIERALQHLEDAKVSLQDICDDIEQEIYDVKKMKKSGIANSLVNAVSVATGIATIAAFPPAAIAGWGAIAAGTAIGIHGVCTIGNLIASGVANELLDKLKIQLADMKKTEIQRQILEDRLKLLLL